MKLKAWLVGLLWVVPALAVVEIGEKAPELCWKKSDTNEICIKELKDKVSVLVYSTGWCPGCQDEMKELSARYPEIKNPNLKIISLSAEGFKHGQAADEEFLKAWQKKYNIPFEVAASPNNAGKEFFTPPYYIPATVILDRSGVVRFKKVDASVDEIFQQVRKLLQVK
jgi:peroxiredoxin